MDEVKEIATPEAPAPEEPIVSLPAAAPAEVLPARKPRDEWGTVRTLALRQLDRFMSFEPKVLRGDDPDSIHDMRVASRRLQQVLDLLYPPPAAGEIRNLRRKIRRCRRALSEVRNCDVLLDHVEGFVRRKRATRREEWTAVEHYLRERRAASFEKALRKLSKVNLAVFYVHSRGYLVTDSAGPPAGRPSRAIVSPQELAPEQFYERVSEALERVSTAFEAQVARSREDSRAPVIHGVRIAAKRVRYLIEVIHEFAVAGSGEILAWLRLLQQHLGDWHDLEVLEMMMIEMVARPNFLRDHLELAMGVEKLILRNRADKKRYEEKYFQLTQDSEGLRRLKEWVGYVLSSPSAAFATA